MKKNGPWILYEESEDTKVYFYENEELPIVKVERKLSLSITKDQIFKTILDIENYNSVITNKNLYSEFVIADSDTLFGYQKTKNYVPFIRDRHLIFKLYPVDENRLQWVIVKKDSQLYDKFKHRRIKELYIGVGGWEFLNSNNVSYLIHYLYVDPDMSIPRFILNRVRKNSAKSVMEDVINYIERNNLK